MKKVLLSLLLLGSSLLNAQGGWGVNSGNSSGSVGGTTTVSGGVYPATHYGYLAPLGMSDMQFAQLKRAICRQSFDDSRIAVAKQGISGNLASATQIRDIVKLLTFESNRLTLAKFSYAFCVDPENYYLVNDAFTFTSSVDELTLELGLHQPVMVNTQSCSNGGGVGMNNYYGGGAYTAPPRPAAHPCGVPVSRCEFDQIKASIEAQCFDDSRLTVAKQIVNAKLLTSAQIRELMELFTFECNRLDLAKFAYAKVFDPQNYYVVNDGFVFTSSVEELSEYIYGF